MEKVGEAVVRKVKQEAERIVNEAQEEAQAELDKAKKQRQAKIENEERRMRTKAQEEAARLKAQGSMKGQQAIARAKADVVNQLVEQVRKSLSETKTEERQLLALIREAVGVLDSNKVTIYTAPKDVSAARGAVRQDKDLSKRVTEIRETDCVGGVIAEDTAGKIRIDNTYDTRLEMLLPRLMPEISKQLFQRS
jgi:V/A-type H+-transporting ATPase subunit E